MPQVGGEHPSMYSEHAGFLKNRSGASTVAFRYSHQRVVPGPSRFFRLHAGHHFSAIDLCWWWCLCFSGGRGQKEEAGAWHMLQTSNQLTTNPRAADFPCVAFAALLYSCRFGVVELQAGKRGNPHHRNQTYCYWKLSNVKGAIGKLQCAMGN